MAIATIRLHALNAGSEAVGVHEGRHVLVPLGIPGETVRVDLQEEGQRRLRGRILEILEPSPERVVPPCSHFGVCGGCHWQHIAYEAQLRLKRENLRTQLQRIGKQPQPLVGDVLGMPEPWAYRNHVQLGFDSEGDLGYQAWHSHEIVAIEECWITHPLLDEVWSALDLETTGLRRISLRAGANTDDQMVIFEGETGDPPELEADVPVSCVYERPDGELIVLAGNSYYYERLHDRPFRISAPSFFQVNTEQAERLLDLVVQYVDPRPDERILDAYCGVGVFALSLAARAAQVIGIEESPWAIDDALANSEEQDNALFIEGAVEDALPDLEGSFAAAVLDPPRAGCSPAALQAIAGKGPRRLVYVSCDPATLARDVRRLEAHGYVLVEVQPVDMFPQTHHLESVALLRLRTSLMKGLQV